jgi:Tol biopolymer transport system component
LLPNRPGLLALLSVVLVAGDAPHAHGAEARRWTPAEISTDQYESTPTFTPDGREMFFMLSDPRFERYRVMWSRCENGAWTPPQSPPFAVAEPVVEADPFVTPDGKRLYFISTRQNRSEQDEDFDIWYVDREADGRWLRAQPLPEPVNSSGSELLPRATSDGRLYFGSDRPGGFGQGDIYVATPDSPGKWRVDNVGPPVNTQAFEYEADVSRDGRTLIVVADRGDRSHLYRFEQRNGRWVERERIPARPDVFQVGPLISPRSDRLLFAQDDGKHSGEIFLIDLAAAPDTSWPPRCDRNTSARDSAGD